MGISIHYRGGIRKKESLPLLIEEVTDVAKAHNWEYFVFDNEFPARPAKGNEISKDLYGVTFSPHGCEGVSFCFLDTGDLTCLLDRMLMANEGFKIRPAPCWTSVKTQHGGAQAHILVVNLIRHLADKYLTSFEMTDEANYWETGDEALVEKKFKEMEGLLEGFSDMLSGEKRNDGESLEDFVKRIAEKTTEF